MDIRVVDIAKDFGGTGALRGVSLDIRDGELIALLGPSGSGKTTLLRVIAGLENPSAGKVLFANEDATSLPVQHRRIGFVFQHYALFRHMTVADNIAYGLRVRPRAEQPAASEITKRVKDLLELVQLPGIERRYPAQLSGGQRQRVALARALAVEPRVLLLDEPLGALDAKVRKDLRRWLRELHDRIRHTTVFVTHDQEEALELADRVAILNEGRIEQVGTPDEVYDAPASPFVMAFVGDTTSMPVEVHDGQPSFAGKPFTADLIGNAEGATKLYLRPGDAVLVKPDGSDLTGTVLGVRRTATGRRVHVRLAPTDTAIEVEAAASRSVEVGETVGVRVLKGRLFGPP
jgi:sulfate transport system ATP-binding protein